MDQLAEHIDLVRPITDDLGVDLYSAGTHPFAEWSQQILTDGHRYEELIARTQWWGRQMLIWGVHVHVGLRNRDHVLPILTSLLNHYPHLQALSASSPVWAGVDTGYASNRAMMFQQLPTAGLPFQFQSWAEFEDYTQDLLTTGVIEQVDEIRWDVRPSPRLGTIEVRICDGVSTMAEMEALVAPHALPRRRPRAAAGGGRDAAVDAAVARAGEQVAQRPLRARRLDHPRRAVPRAAAPRRSRGASSTG
jgi:carboxylate-amine ligase